MARYGYPYENVYQILLIYLIGDLNNWFVNATNKSMYCLKHKTSVHIGNSLCIC